MGKLTGHPWGSQRTRELESKRTAFEVGLRLRRVSGEALSGKVMEMLLMLAERRLYRSNVGLMGGAEREPVNFDLSIPPKMRAPFGDEACLRSRLKTRLLMAP